MKKILHRLSEPADTLLARLEAAAVRDDQAEKRIKIGCATALAMVVGGGLGLGYWSEQLGSKLPFLGLLLVVPVLALVAREHGHDVDDRKLDAAIELIRTLRADVPAAEPIQLLLDFREYHQAGTKRVDPAAPKAKAKAKPGQPEKYLHKWLEVRTTLADGTAVDAAITDRVSRKSKPKRKYVKVKETFVSDVSLLLRLDKRYGPAEQVIPRLGHHPDLSWCNERVKRGRGRRLFLAVRTPAARRSNGRGTSAAFQGVPRLGSGTTILAMLSWAYYGLGRGAAKAA